MCIICFCLGAMLGTAIVAMVICRCLNDPVEYGKWLGRPCWMRNRYRKGKRWLKYRVVAVSHRGGIAVRKWDDDSGQHAFWIDKERVPTTVRFDDMTIGCEQ